MIHNRLLLFSAFCISVCNTVYPQSKVNWWLTTQDKYCLVSKQLPLRFKETSDSVFGIEIHPELKFQTIDGFGFALTGGSAHFLMLMPGDKQDSLMQELFSVKNRKLGISYIRISIGSSDLNDHVYTYDDLPDGETDIRLRKFSMNEDLLELIPILKKIIQINPDIKILASPWSAPSWMKSNHLMKGGKLKEEYYSVYAKYLLKYIKGMLEMGIRIDALTIQNEPFNDGNNPSMQFYAKQELIFIRNFLGPIFNANHIQSKIILYDHNCDAPEYPLSLLEDSIVRKYVDGSGFHLYAGQVTAMTTLHNAFPEKNIYLTEMMITDKDGFNIADKMEKIIIGPMRNWSRNIVLWNLASNTSYEPHTNDGGCPVCQGALTFENDSVCRNLAYYTLRQASEFIPTGSLRIESSVIPTIANVAFITPENNIVLIISNNSETDQCFNIVYQKKSLYTCIKKESVATYVWKVD